MKKTILFLFVFLLAFATAYATHNRAGEITYEYLYGTTYRIRVTTYTNTINTQADRCEISVHFGDGDTAMAPRVNGGIGGICPFPLQVGVQITANTKHNIYEINHTFPGPNTYVITVEDPNRNEGICNIPGSVNQSFFLHSELVINPFLGHNTSVTLLRLPIDDACVGVCFEHNPTAYDADGDSLYYSLVPCYGGGQPIPGYTLPPNMSQASLDHQKGDLLWCAPDQICQYNIAILIQEYRRLPGSSHRYYIGSVVRDMQINVGSCLNTPPVIKNLNDTCVVAGSQLQFNVSATDAQLNVVTLNASGGPFVINPTAQFNSVSGNPTATGVFKWTPTCTEVRLLPYLVTFKATDSDPTIPLVSFESIFIRVISPAPTGITATPSGSNIIVHWNAPVCGSTTGNNPLSSYSIYRKNSCDPWLHSVCETGVPASSGYTLVGTTTGTVTTFVDNGNGAGLVHGIDYSYMVVANFFDASQSYASTNVCARLVRDVPIITNVSVLSTDAANGTVWVHWLKPLATGLNLDTLANPPPYQFRVMEATGQGSGVSTFSLVATYNYSAYWQMTDTGFVVNSLNTLGAASTYQVDLYSNSIFKGSSHTASSVFLLSTPAGNQVNLSWQAMVPWINYKYFVYRAIPVGSSNFVLIDSTTSTTYTDTGLVNNVNYCYKVVSKGDYTDTALPRPLVNTSQIRCEKPIDIIPPCQPRFDVAIDCGLFKNVLTWTNPNTYCSHDAVGYNIYFAATTTEDLQLIYSITDVSTTSYTHQYLYDGVASVAGCYAVTAVDTFANESPIITKVCVDNCPEYELPNVFSPNSDNVNDLVTPLPGYRYVKDVEFTIYDRWGLMMFETNDPAILWDGKNKDTKMLCSDGVYYYICTVNEIHVDGIQPRVLKGFIQLLNQKTTTSN